jgi:sugar lactone lactonase YvrE
MDAPGLLTRTEHDGTITVLAECFDGKKLTGPNDVAVKSDGSIWFSDNGAGAVSVGDMVTSMTEVTDEKEEGSSQTPIGLSSDVT